MAESRDDRVSRAYRELRGDGPGPAIDAAIQAAARRAVGARPGGARRWQVPVSVAAVLALAIGVSLQVDREKPVDADDTPLPSGSAEYPVPQAEAVAPTEERPAIASAPVQADKPAAAAGPAAPVEPLRAAPQAVPRPAPQDVPRAAPPVMQREKSEAPRDAASLEKQAADALEPPERRLERISELRAKGLHEEADRALAEFRRLHPGYRISEEWLRKVER